MDPIFLKRFLAGLVLLAVSLLAFCFAPRQGEKNYWYKPRWMRAGALY